MSKQEILDRIEEIRSEVSNTYKPRLRSNSLEDWDSLAQAKLEWSYWRDEIQSEYLDLCKEAGIKPEPLQFR